MVLLRLSLMVFAVLVSEFQILADDVILNHGTIISGQTELIPGISQEAIQRNLKANVAFKPLWQIMQPQKRYVVPKRQVQAKKESLNATPYEIFEIDQPQRGGKTLTVLGIVDSSDPFSEFGRRRLKVQTLQGVEDVVQGIVEIRPDITTLKAVEYAWEYAVSTKSLPLDQLLTIIRKTIETSAPEDRLKVVAFLLNLGRPYEASLELDQLIEEFPDRIDQFEQTRTNIRQLLAQRLINEIKSRKEAGQHRLAYHSILKFPTKNIASANLREVKEIGDDYDQSVEQSDLIDSHLKLLLAELQSHPDYSQLAIIVNEITSSLGYDQLSRLLPFQRTCHDPSETAETKLALAISGWVLGGAYAVENLREALNMVQARQLMLDYLRAESPQRMDLILADLSRLEGIGHETLEKIVPLMPLENPAVLPADGHLMRWTTPDQLAGYAVQTPLEYSPLRSYPLLVVLHENGRTSEQEIQFWAGTVEQPGMAMREGYVTIGVDYLPNNEQFDNNVLAYHARIAAAIRDCCRRYQINQDRVYLLGHGSGGTAALDLSVSHPDQFAGTVAVTAAMPAILAFYRENSPSTPLYLVNGSIDPITASPDLFHIDHMMQRGWDIIYAEYLNRAHETFFEEQESVFAWMERLRRRKFPEEIQVQTRRPTEDRFYWLRLTAMQIPSGRGLQAEATVLKTNKINVTTGAEHFELLVSPELINFDKFFSVRFKSRNVFSDFPIYETQTMLEELKKTGDRQKLYWMKITQ